MGCARLLGEHDNFLQDLGPTGGWTVGLIWQKKSPANNRFAELLEGRIGQCPQISIFDKRLFSLGLDRGQEHNTQEDDRRQQEAGRQGTGHKHRPVTAGEQQRTA